MTGSLAAVNTALNGFTYTAALGAATPDTLQVTINDQGNTGSGGPQSTSQNVTIDVVPHADGCELTLTHVMDPRWADYVDRTAAGWTKILASLAATIG